MLNYYTRFKKQHNKLEHKKQLLLQQWRERRW